MNRTTVIRNATVVNEGFTQHADILIRNGRIEQIGKISSPSGKYTEIDASGLYLLPGVIDDQVHFREPGLTHKGDIASESAAAAAGGTTSFMEMPNTVPQTLTAELLESKYQVASKTSAVNFAFYLGASNTNIDEVKKIDPRLISGVKVFMGSSTGDMLVDSEKVLEQIFSEAPTLVAVHCEDEQTIRQNLQKAKAEYGEDISAGMHPVIRNAEACYLSSSKAVALARKFNTRLHILHISTAKEIELFRNDVALTEKRITAEVCVHHLWFSEADYKSSGNLIKWNPAVKSVNDRAALRTALLDNRLDIIATDHAPHTREEKALPYLQCPSGGPLVQHSLNAMLECVKDGWISMERVVEKMCHAPALCFQVKERGFIREGYFADIVLVDMNNSWTVNTGNILYKCGWSPFNGTTFSNRVMSTFVNGVRVYHEGEIRSPGNGMRLEFNRG